MKKTILLLTLSLIIISGCSTAAYVVPLYRMSTGDASIVTYISKYAYPKEPLPLTILVKGQQYPIKHPRIVDHMKDFWVIGFELEKEFMVMRMFDFPDEVEVVFLDENGRKFTLKAYIESVKAGDIFPEREKRIRLFPPDNLEIK